METVERLRAAYDLANKRCLSLRKDNSTKRQRKAAGRARRSIRKALARAGVDVRRRRDPRAWQTYGQRDQVLREMGYRSYAEYLASDLWKRIRAMAFLKHGSSCKLCGGIAEVVHHVGYGRAALAGTSLRQLAPVCRPCHDKVEVRPDGRKRSFVEAHTAWTKMLRAFKRSRRQGA